MLKQLLITSVITSIFSIGSFASEETSSFVPITSGVKSIKMNLNGESFTIMRNQTRGNKISPLYETTNRGKPQPMTLGKGIETVGEVEFIELMKKAQKDEKIAIIDSRKPGWFEKLRIPGALNVPFTDFDNKEEAISAMEDEMGVVQKEDGTLDFSNAKTVALYCNGYWCGQTPAMIKNAKYSLLNMGYPVSKIKYYRGGMQAWTSLGFTVVGSGK